MTDESSRATLHYQHFKNVCYCYFLKLSDGMEKICRLGFKTYDLRELTA